VPCRGLPWGFRCGGKKATTDPFEKKVRAAGALPAFLTGATLKGDQLPPHGATGPGHFALGVEAESFDPWRKVLRGHGVSIGKEVEWPRGGWVGFYPRNGRG
jgi:hypothetical protein